MPWRRLGVAFDIDEVCRPRRSLPRGLIEQAINDDGRAGVVRGVDPRVIRRQRSISGWPVGSASNQRHHPPHAARYTKGSESLHRLSVPMPMISNPP